MIPLQQQQVLPAKDIVSLFSPVFDGIKVQVTRTTTAFLLYHTRTKCFHDIALCPNLSANIIREWKPTRTCGDNNDNPHIYKKISMEEFYNLAYS